MRDTSNYITRWAESWWGTCTGVTPFPGCPGWGVMWDKKQEEPSAFLKKWLPKIYIITVHGRRPNDPVIFLSFPGLRAPSSISIAILGTSTQTFLGAHLRGSQAITKCYLTTKARSKVIKPTHLAHGPSPCSQIKFPQRE